MQSLSFVVPVSSVTSALHIRVSVKPVKGVVVGVPLQQEVPLLLLSMAQTQAPTSQTPSEELCSSNPLAFSLASVLAGLQIVLLLFQVLLLLVNLSFGFALKHLLLDALQALMEKRCSPRHVHFHEEQG